MEAWIASHSDIVLGALGATFATASGVLPGKVASGHWYSWVPAPNWLAIVPGVVFLVWGGVVAAKKSVRVEDLRHDLAQSELKRAKIQAELDEWALSTGRIMERLCESFGAALRASPRERVSIYRPNAEGDFVRLARHSKNPEFLSSGRLKYPRGEGVLGEAWQHMTAKCTLDLSDCGNERQWVKAMAHSSGIAREDLRRMTMKSRTLFAARIEDASTRSGCAVLVFESTRYRTELDPMFGELGVEGAFHQLFTADLGEALCEAVGIMSRLLQQVDPDRATEEGF